uniref:Uncharacterized protein n=1 Tax=Lepeophtheirus salmonis TaxID=72036 RepID=A0A0K2VFM2_LEPSM
MRRYFMHLFSSLSTITIEYYINIE